MDDLEFGLLVGLIALAAARRRPRPPTVIPLTEAERTTPQPLEPPPGWRRLRPEEVITNPMGAFARDKLRTLGPIGNLQVGEVDGRTLAALTDWHYHPEGGEARPWGWHRGITLLVPTEEP